MPEQPNVPWYVAASVGAAIAVCGFVLVYNDPAFVIPPAIRFAVGALNAALGIYAIYLNVKGIKPNP